MEQKMELIARFGLTVEQLDFDIDSMTEEELEAKLTEIAEGAGAGSVDGEGSGDQGGSGSGGAAFALSGEQFREVLIDALSGETVETEWGSMCRYMYWDYDSDVCQVYCYDTEDWKLYGFPYSMNGDNVVIDFACKKRKKFSIVDFDEGDADFSYKQLFETVAQACAAHKESELNSKFESEKAELEEKYNTASETMKTLNSELMQLRQYQQQKLADERAAGEDAVFAMFTDLSGIEAFEALRADCSALSIEEIEEKCYAIRGRNTKKSFSASTQKGVRTPAGAGHPADEPYGGLFIEYPPLTNY